MEIDAASKCNIFIGAARMGKGSHVELGLALGGDARRIILVGVDPADSVFYTPCDRSVVVDRIDAVLGLIQ